MRKNQRLEIFRANLTKVVKGGDGSYVIFDTSKEKFVQFVGGREMGLICDIPLVELSQEQKKGLLTLKEFSEGEGAKDANTGELTAYQIEFDKDDIDKAVELTERIFIEVFKSLEDYSVQAKLNIEDPAPVSGEI